MTKLAQLYEDAARAAFNDGIDAGNENQLITWIRENCGYKTDNEFFLVLGVGNALANMQSKARGYESNIHEAFVLANKKMGQ